LDGAETISLSKQSIENLIDLVEIKIGCLQVIDREDARSIVTALDGSCHREVKMTRIMSNWPIICAACIALLALAGAATPSAAANACIFDWAVPGTYGISGNFRGRTETVPARLTHDCRVAISLPGVFTGGPLRRQGRCLAFSFRIEGERQPFSAQWCGSYGVVPWQGRNVRATIVRRQDRTIIQSR
jgi:hypothetical protein